jgi:hypothetical protein
MLRTVEWSSSVYLACSTCLPSDVILCVRGELLPQSIEGYELTTIDASLTAASKMTSCDCAGLYRYTIEYDDALVLEGVELICSDITGVVCKGCLTKWIEDQFALLSAEEEPI